MHGPKYQLQIDKGERQGLLVDRHGNLVVNNNGVELHGAVLDRKSIVQRNFGSIALTCMLAKGIEQVMDPATGAAVEYISDFWPAPVRRFRRSIPPILSVVYAGNAQEWGEEVRGYHNKINVTDEMGRHHKALDPETFYWAHDTFKEGTAAIAEYYSPYPFTRAHREQLQLESNTWYANYGMPMGPVPEDYTAYLKWRDDWVTNKLEMTPSADRAINMLMDHKLPIHEFVPKRMRGLARAALMSPSEMIRIFGIGEISPDIRHRFDIPFSDDDQQKLDNFRGVSRLLWKPLPNPILYQGVAYESHLREMSGRHKNVVDRMTHTALSVGMAAFNHLQRAFSPDQTEDDFYPDAA